MNDLAKLVLISNCCCVDVAVAALHMASVIQQKDARQWFAELAVDLEKVSLAFLLLFQCSLPIFRSGTDLMSLLISFLLLGQCFFKKKA